MSLGIYGGTVNTAYILVNLQQGTTEWLQWRKGGIGASDAPTIMGENPWKTADELLLDKLGRAKPVGTTAAMARGTALEPEARRRYESMTRISVAPACLQSTKHEWQRASVDGLATDGSAVVEIKCGESVYAKTAGGGRVPSYYVGQLQHILAVTALPQIDFFCWLPNRPEVHLRVKRDDRYIARLLVAEEAFWQKLMKRNCQS